MEQDNQPALTIFGMGYVGLPLAREAVKAGMTVTGVDVSEKRVATIREGKSPVGDLTDEDITEMLNNGFRVDTIPHYPGRHPDVIVICVPTPLSDADGPDLTFVRAATRSAGAMLRPGALVVLESTTYPGTTDEVIKPLLEEESGLRAGRDFALAFSPERIDPGNPVYGLVNTAKVVGGYTPACTERAAAFYSLICKDVVTAKSAREAEMTKLLENTYRQVNIALLNEMAIFSHDMGIDIWDVVRCAATKPFGFESFRPGPGVGGHCGKTGELVLTEHGPREIETIRSGDRVLAADGRLHRVLDTIVRDYDGPLSVIRTRGMPAISYTSEHKIPVATDRRSRPNEDGWTRNSVGGVPTQAALLDPEQVEARLLVPKQHLMFWPDIQPDFSVLIPNHVTDDYLRLAGWYLSEGSSLNKSTLTFGLHTNEVEYQQEITNLLRLVGENQHVGVSIYPKNHSHVLRYHSKDLMTQVIDDFGRYQHDRTIPSWILFGPEKNIAPVLRGLFCGDAWLNDTEAQLSTTSRDLAYGSLLLLNRLGIVARIKERNRANRRAAFEVIVRGSDHLAKFYNLIDVGIQVRDVVTPVLYPQRDGKTYRRVQSVRTEHYEGKVYNLHVEDNHTYLTPAGIVQNCIAIDAKYLASKVLATTGYPFRFVELAQEVNNKMPAYVVTRAAELLNKHSKPLWGSLIMLYGVTYKPNVADQRESVAPEIARRLMAAGAKVLYDDPYASEWFVDGIKIQNREDQARAFLSRSPRDPDLAILLQAHSTYNLDGIASTSALLLDTTGRAPRFPQVEAL